MKIFIFWIVALLPGLHLLAQDTVFFRNGRVVPAKVHEVNPDDIKYKKADNPNGPLYAVPKAEVEKVVYANGTKDIFEEEQNNYATNNDPNVAFANPGGPALNIMLGIGWPYWSFYRSWGWGPRWTWGWGAWGRSWNWGWYSSWGFGRGFHRDWGRHMGNMGGYHGHFGGGHYGPRMGGGGHFGRH